MCVYCECSHAGRRDAAWVHPWAAMACIHVAIFTSDLHWVKSATIEFLKNPCNKKIIHGFLMMMLLFIFSIRKFVLNDKFFIFFFWIFFTFPKKSREYCCIFPTFIIGIRYQQESRTLFDAVARELRLIFRSICSQTISASGSPCVSICAQPNRCTKRPTTLTRPQTGWIVFCPAFCSEFHLLYIGSLVNLYIN